MYFEILQRPLLPNSGGKLELVGPLQTSAKEQAESIWDASILAQSDQRPTLLVLFKRKVFYTLW